MKRHPSPATNDHPNPRTCGFRLISTDVIILIAGGILSAFGYVYVKDLALLIPFVVGHFFLFCNVFRVRRKPELIWAGIFLINNTAWSLAGNVNVPGICVTQLIATVIIIGIELKSDQYHGVFAKQINAKIDAYLRKEI